MFNTKNRLEKRADNERRISRAIHTASQKEDWATVERLQASLRQPEKVASSKVAPLSPSSLNFSEKDAYFRLKPLFEASCLEGESVNLAYSRALHMASGLEKPARVRVSRALISGARD